MFFESTRYLNHHVLLSSHRIRLLKTLTPVWQTLYFIVLSFIIPFKHQTKIINKKGEKISAPRNEDSTKRFERA